MKTLFYALILSWILPISLGNASEQDRTAFFLPEIDAFSQWDKENSFPKRAVLFVGSSSINYWPSAEAFPEVPIINRGFGGSISTDILYFYDRVIAKYRPRTVVIYVGDNDIALGLTSEKTSDTLKILIQKIAHDFPKTRIIYLPIKPSLLRWDMWPDMKKVNENIANYAKKSKHVFYIYSATPLLGADGMPDKKYFVDDGLHLNEAGYRIWNKLLEPYLK